MIHCLTKQSLLCHNYAPGLYQIMNVVFVFWKGLSNVFVTLRFDVIKYVLSNPGLLVFS